MALAARKLEPEPLPKSPDWRPHPGPQSAFLELDVDEGAYGGAAGGGKSESLLVDALYDYRNPHYRGLLLRRTFPELKESLIDRSHALYRPLGGRYNVTDHQWKFPSGAKITFGHMEHEDDRFKFKSNEYQYIGFDELTSFTEVMYRYLISRLRSSHGIKTRLRGGSNPGGEGHDWMLKRFAPWLDKSADYEGPRVEPGHVLWFLTDEDTGEDVWVPRGTPDALSRTFIAARVTDNPSVSADYISRLKALDPLSRKQLLEGDWMARPSAGIFFKRHWFRAVPSAPTEGRFVRFWDRAATEANDPSSGKPKNDPDWTVGMKLHLAENGVVTICDVIRFRASPGVVEETIKQTALLDSFNCHVWFSLDPGQAGKFEYASYIRELMGYVVQAMAETGDKVTRAKPVSAYCEAGTRGAPGISMVVAKWNELFLHEAEDFPTVGVHDDQIDALSGGFAALVGEAIPPLGKKVVRARRSFRGD